MNRLLLLTLLVTPVFAQNAADVEANKKRFKEYEKRGLLWGYDPFRDETTLMTKPQIVYKPGKFLSVAAAMANEIPSVPTIGMLVGLQYKGREMPQKPTEAILFIQVSASYWQQLKSDREVRIMFEGGEVVLLGTATYDAEIARRGTAVTSESMMVPIKLEHLERMANAKSVNFQIGRSFIPPIKDKFLKTFQPLVAEMKK